MTKALIDETVRDYFEGWFDGDVERMDRALHPDLVKRWAGEEQGAPLPSSRPRSACSQLTARGEGRKDGADRTLEVEIEDVCEDIASVTVRSAVYHEYVHLVRTRDGWKIANAFWRYT